VTFGSGPTSAAGYGTKSSEEVDVGSDKLVHRIVVPTQISVNGQRFQETVVVTFSRSGVPLYVVPPPSGQQVTLAQYESSAGSSNSSD
jgi:hypothetical protein